MIERILEQAQAIRHVLADERRSSISLTWQDTDVLQAINAALKPVSAFTDILSGENCVSSSCVLPMLKLCSEEMLVASDDDVPLTKAIKAGIIGKLGSKYENEDVRKLLRKCTFLDPRYRGGYEADDASLAETKKWLEEEMLAMRSEAAARAVEEREDGQEDDARSEPPKKKVTLGSLLQKTAAASAPERSTEDQAASELSAYCSEPVTSGDEDPLIWWRTNETRFSMMSKLAKNYLCACATSVPSERLFSTAGNIVSPARSLLKPDKVNQLVFLAKNLE